MPNDPYQRSKVKKNMAKASLSFSKIHRVLQSHSVPVFGGILASFTVKLVVCTYGARWPNLLSPSDKREQAFRHISLHNAVSNHHKCAKSVHDKGSRTTRQLANWKWSQVGKRQSGFFNALLKPASNVDTHGCTCTCLIHSRSFFSRYRSWLWVFRF